MSKLILHRPLQRYIITKIIEAFNTEYPKNDVPEHLPQLTTEHFRTTKKSKRSKKFTLGQFLLDEVGKKNKNLKIGTNHRKLYLLLWKEYKSNSPSIIDLPDKYLEYFFLFFDVEFTFEDVSRFLDRIRLDLKSDKNEEILEGEFELQKKEFKKLEVFQLTHFYYRCYISDFDHISKGALILSRELDEPDVFNAALSIQIKTGEHPAEGNQIFFSGTPEELGSFTYFDLRAGDKKSRAFWVLHTPNRRIVESPFITGTYSAVDKSGDGSVSGQLFLEKVDTEQALEDHTFFELPVPEPIFLLFKGKKEMAPVKEVLGINKLEDLVRSEVKDFAGVYKCFFLNMPGNLLRECIYKIDKSGKVLGKVAVGQNTHEPGKLGVYTYKGMIVKDPQTNHFRIEIEGEEKDSYQVFLNNLNKKNPTIYYGIYFGWDGSKRLRAGREIFIPQSSKYAYEELNPKNHAKGSIDYQQLCEQFQIDDFFESFQYSSFPNLSNWMPRETDLSGREPVPAFITGTYVAYRLNPMDVEDAAPYLKQISKDVLEIMEDGSVLLSSKGNRTLKGKVFKTDRFLYMSVKADDKYKFAIYFIDTFSEYTDAIYGITLEVNEFVNTVVGNREVLFPVDDLHGQEPELKKIDQGLIDLLEHKLNGTSNFLIGPNDSYIRLPERPINAQTRLKKKHDYGKIYFYTACFAARIEDPVWEIKRYLGEAFRHGFSNWERLAYELENGALVGIKKDLQLAEVIKQALLKTSVESRNKSSFKASKTAKVFQIPFRGKYNPDFIDEIFEEYKKAEHELHIIGEVSKAVSNINEDLIDKLDTTIRSVLNKNDGTKVCRYQTVRPVNEYWLEKMVALKSDFGERFELYAKGDQSDLSNINIMLIDPYHEKNTNILILTRDNEDREDIPVPIYALVEKDDKHLSEGLLRKVRKLKRSCKELTTEAEIRAYLA
ncbi:MAG: hypothetical protein AAF798_07005 [Bacteroidota bacterium]